MGLAKRALALGMAFLNLAMLCFTAPADGTQSTAAEPVLPLSAENDLSTETDISWFDADNYATLSRFEVSGAAQLAGLATLVNGTAGLFGQYSFAGKTIAAVGDFDLSAFQAGGGWVPIGTAENPFRGVFDGAGASVTGLFITRGPDANQGLFGVVTGSTLLLAGVHNLTVASPSVHGGDGTGIVAGRADHAVLSNCHVAGGAVTGGQHVGGIVGRLGAGGMMDNCSVGAEVSGSDHTGGLVGMIAEAGVTLRNGRANGAVSGGAYTGGIAGQVVARAAVENCSASGLVTGTGAFTGGIAGYCEGSVEYCLATGGVSGVDDTGGVVGGLGGGAVANVQVGETFGGGTLRASANTGPVRGGKHTGGVAGFVSGNDDYLAVLEQCYNTGSVRGGDYTGGVAGHTHGLVRNSYSTGDVAGASRTGGVTGGLTTFSDEPPEGRGSLINCFTSGSVTGELYVGGVCGSLRGGEISGSAVMGPSVTGTVESVLARIYGSEPLNVAAISDNYAWKGLELRLESGGSVAVITPPSNTVGAGRQNGAALSAEELMEADRAAQMPWKEYAAAGEGVWNLSTGLPTLIGVPGLQDGSAPEHLLDPPEFEPGSGVKFVNHPNWVEITGDEAYYKFRNNESFIVVYYRPNCAQSKAWRSMFYTWVARRETTVYGVPIEKDTDVLWLYPGVFNAVYTRPVMGFIHQKELQTCDGTTAPADVRRAFEEWPGHAAAQPFDFEDVNSQTLASYEVDDLSPYLAAEPDIQAGNAAVKQKSAEIVEGAATDTEKLAAIHAWVSGNVYFDVEMLLTGAGRPTDAAGVLAQEGKLPNKMHTSAQGYANLTAALCRAAGIPCRVVSGFAAQASAVADAAVMQKACEAYAAGDLLAFENNAATLRNHAWNAAFVDGEWQYLDTALDSRNEVHINSANSYAALWVADAPAQDYLCPPLERFSETHCTWDGAMLAFATDFALEWTNLLLPAGASYQFTPVPLPEGSSFRPGTVFSWDIAETTIANVDASGLVTALYPGTATLTVKATIGGKAKTAACTLTLLERLTGVRMEESEVLLRPGQKKVLVLLPLPAASLVTEKVEWAVLSGAGSVAVDENGIVTALAAGQAVVQAATTDAAGLPLTATCTVSVRPMAVGVTLSEQSLLLIEGEMHALAAQVAPADALQRVSWHSGDESVVRVSSQTDVGASLEAVGAGSAVVWATAVDGGQSAACRVTVKKAYTSKLAFAQQAMVLGGAAPAVLNLSLDDAEVEPQFTLYRSSSREMVKIEDVFSRFDYATASDIEAVLTVAALSAAEQGAYVLRARVGAVWAECRLTVARDASQAESAADFAGLYLDTTAVTLWTRSGQSPSIAIRQDRDGRIPLDLSDTARVTVQLRGGQAHKWDGLFAFSPLDGERLKVRCTLPAKAASRYKFVLEVVVDAGGGKTFTLPVKGKLAVAVKTGLPKLTATAITVNTFVASEDAQEDAALRTVPIQINGATPDKIRLRAGAKQPDWVTFNEEAQTVTVAAGTKSRKGTVYLQVQPAGWDAGSWVNVSLRVKRTYAAPGLKLSASRVGVYADLSRWAGSPLALKPKSGRNTLTGLGITGLCVAPEHAHRFTVADFDPVGGAFTLAAADGAAPASLPGKVTLLASVAGSSRTVSLSVRAVKVAANTTVRLRAAKTTLTLNPGLQNGERADIKLSTNIAGFALGQYELSAKVYDKSGKKAPPASEHPPTADVSGDVLTVRVSPHTAQGKTYKVKVTLPGVNRNKKGEAMDHVLTLTLKTAREGTAVKVGLSASGKLDLTTGAKARITAKFTGALGGFAGVPEFVWLDGKGGALPPETAAAFEATAHPDGGWQVGLRAECALRPGTYRVGIDTEKSPLAGGGFPDSAGTVRFKVAASSPKIALASQTATLYHNDPDSEAIVQLQMPKGAPPVAGVHLAGGEKDSFAYTLRPLGDGYYAVVFDRDKPAKTLQKARGTKLTLEVTLEGCETPAQSISLTLKVKYRK